MESSVQRSGNDIELAPGVSGADVERIDSSEHLAGVLAGASARATSVVPFGGRHSLGTGFPAETYGLGLDLTGLSGIIGYEPADLTVSVWAGTTIESIQHTLAESGQEIPLDVPYPASTTVGGLAATGFAGPRRLRSGSLRDLLIGCEFVRGDGMQAKAGGLVVKNVSGFEIPRFLHGSWGTLAVLTSVNLKVTPMPRSDGTVFGAFDDIGTAIDVAQRLIATDPSIEACVVTTDPGGILVAARAMGRERAVSASLQEWAATLGSGAQGLEGSHSRDWWQRHVERFAEDHDHILVAVACRSRDIPSLVSRLVGMPGAARWSVQVSPGTGSIRIQLPARLDDAITAVQQVVATVGSTGASYVIESAPVSLREVIPVWGADPDGLRLMRSIKQQFDPAGILNRGRFSY